MLKKFSFSALSLLDFFFVHTYDMCILRSEGHAFLAGNSVLTACRRQGMTFSKKETLDVVER